MVVEHILVEGVGKRPENVGFGLLKHILGLLEEIVFREPWLEISLGPVDVFFLVGPQDEGDGQDYVVLGDLVYVLFEGLIYLGIVGFEGECVG